VEGPGVRLRALTEHPAKLDAVRRPWGGAIRRGLRNRPYVVLPGGLYVAETPSRRNAGAHYTPRALAEEVVRHALEPLVFRPGPYQTPDSSAWRRLAPSDILALKVADIACGSGAFLVAAARYLADHLMEAWEQDGIAERFLASGHGPQELENRALREVVAHCLYGVDINPMAVEMCKLSLWLVSLDPRLPFSFVDDKILTGNSLLGITDIRQLEELHIDPAAASATPMFSLDDRGAMVVLTDLHERLECVAERRRELTIPVVEDDPQRSTNAKRQTLRRNDADLEIPRLLADAVIAAGLGAGGGPGRARTEAYEALREAVGRAYPADGRGGADMRAARGATSTGAACTGLWSCRTSWSTAASTQSSATRHSSVRKS